MKLYNPKEYGRKVDEKMTEKLKTLNDLEEIAGTEIYKSKDGKTPERMGIVRIDRLRQEAIKYFKHYKEMEKKEKYEKDKLIWRAVMEFIIRIFNLKDEDLK